MLSEGERFSVTLNRPDAEILTVVPEPIAGPGPGAERPSPLPELVFRRVAAGPQFVMFVEIAPGEEPPATAVADRVRYPVRFRDSRDRVAWALEERARPKSPLPPVERAIWLVRYFAHEGVFLRYQPWPEPGDVESWARAPAPAGERPPLGGPHVAAPTWLPAGTQEGDILAVTVERAPDGGSVTIRVAPDPAARALLHPATWEFLRRVDEVYAWRRERDTAGAERTTVGAPRRFWIVGEVDAGSAELSDEEWVEGFPDVRGRSWRGGLPLRWLPDGVAEDDVLAVTDEREPGGAVVLRVTPDPAIRDEFLRRSREQIERINAAMRRRDEAGRRGGDSPPG